MSAIALYSLHACLQQVNLPLSAGDNDIMNC